MSTIAAIIAGLLLTGATVAGVVTSVSDHSHRTTEPGANVQLYGSR